MKKLLTIRVYRAIAIMIAILAIGTVGYIFIEGLHPLQALYMTVITVTTVGYSEVRPLSQEGQIFTIIFIITSVGGVAYAVGSISSQLIDGDFRRHLKRIKMEKRIDTMRNHVIVCGYGRNGSKVCDTLEEQKIDYVVVEREADLCEKLREQNKMVLNDDPTNDDVLLAAGIHNARALITTLPDDASNLFIVLSARELNKQLKIVSRASNEGSERKLKIAGANNVIMPYKIGGTHMASLVANPDVKEFVDILLEEQRSSARLKEVVLHPESKVVGKTIGDIRENIECEALVLALIDENNEYIINPKNDRKIGGLDKLIVLGDTEQIDKFKRVYM